MLLRIGQPPDHGFDEPLGMLSDCHRRIEHFLALLVTVAAQAGGGALSTTQRGQLEAAATYFRVAAPRHTADEEESLFPRLRELGEPAAEAIEIVKRLEREHHAVDEHHQVVDALVRRWLADGTLDDEAVTELTWRLDALQRTYKAHIAVEDEQLFPAAGRLLPETDVQAIGREMAARRQL